LPSLDNLITNAIKFTEEGFVKLSVSYDASGEMTSVQFSIEDSGIGIEKADLDKLFLPFVQVDQSTTRIYGGSGLGLSIARKVCFLCYTAYLLGYGIAIYFLTIH
jgi:signal transduction histidine kinase